MALKKVLPDFFLWEMETPVGAVQSNERVFNLVLPLFLKHPASLADSAKPGFFVAECRPISLLFEVQMRTDFMMR